MIYSLLVQRAELKSQEREAIDARETQSKQNATIAAQLFTMERSLALQQEMAEVGSRPLLLLQNISKHEYVTVLTLRNYGAVFFEPKVESSKGPGGYSISVTRPPGIEWGERADFPLQIEWSGPEMPPRVLIVLSYTNKHGYRGRYEVLLSEGHDVIERSRVVGLTG